MGWRRTTWIILLGTVLSGCGSPQYRNPQDPGADLSRDMTDCRGTSMVPSAPFRVGGEYDRAILVVDENMLAQCLAARGWSRVSP